MQPYKAFNLAEDTHLQILQHEIGFQSLNRKHLTYMVQFPILHFTSQSLKDHVENEITTLFYNIFIVIFSVFKITKLKLYDFTYISEGIYDRILLLSVYFISQ